MKINGFTARTVGNLGSTQAASQAGQLPNRAPGGASDRVQLSNLGAYLAAARSDSPAHAAKLSSLTAAVSSDAYQVDPAAVSAGIIQDSLQFSGANWL